MDTTHARREQLARHGAVNIETFTTSLRKWQYT